MMSPFEWTWDPAKNRENERKHGFRFEDVISIFDDPTVHVEEDPYPYEQRWQAIGWVEDSMLMVIYTPPSDMEGCSQPGRIISARKVERWERRKYEEGQD